MALRFHFLSTACGALICFPYLMASLMPPTPFQHFAMSLCDGFCWEKGPFARVSCLRGLPGPKKHSQSLDLPRHWNLNTLCQYGVRGWGDGAQWGPELMFSLRILWILDYVRSQVSLPAHPLEPLCLASVPQDPQNAIFGLILEGP